MTDPSDPREAVHEAISQFLADGEIAVSWALTIDVAGPDGRRYLAHRHGGGHDGRTLPLVWTVIGLLRAALVSAEQEVAACTRDPDPPDPPVD